MRRGPLDPPLNPPLIPLYRIAISAIRPVLSMNSNATELKQVLPTHILLTSCRSSWPRGVCFSLSLNPNPHSWKIYFRVSGFQSSFLLIHFRHLTECLITLQQSVAQDLSDIWRSTFQRRRVAFLRYRNRAEKLLPFLCVNRIPVRFDFKRRAGARAVWYSENRP